MGKKELILFVDCGDTLVDESTEIRNGEDVVIAEELFEGAEQAIRTLHREGYRIALVADGLEASFQNIISRHHLEDCFEAKAISETVGAEKPSPAMFRSAMEQMGLTAQDSARIVMIGNNLERDIVGANRMGFWSVLAGYSPRYRMMPQSREERPDYVIQAPSELPGLVERLRLALARTPQNQDTFWYRKPAEKWIEALPLGNGRLGAMVYGGALEEKIQVDENTFWSGKPSDQNNRPDSYELLGEIRRQLMEENYEEADRLGHDFVGRKNQYGTNLPVGNLFLRLEGAGKEVSEYRRSLSLSEALSETRFKAGDVSFEREMFVSNPDQAAVIRMRGSEPFGLRIWYEGIDSSVRITGLLPQKESRPGRNVFRIEGDAREGLHSDGQCGVHLEGTLVIDCDGQCRYENSFIFLSDCREVVCFMDLETNLFLQNPEETAAERAYRAAETGYEGLLQRHRKDVRRLYGRVELMLEDEEDVHVGGLPTDERIERMAEGGQDNDLCRLMFQYGRYLLIASSREDSCLPTHMGGIWNDNIYCRIDCTQDMHIDMNLQMQYWAAAQCGLEECYAPFFRYLEEIIIPSGMRTAREVYHANGFTAHVVTNPWGFTSLGWGYNWGVFSLGGAWCAAMAWNYFEYTQDKKWLGEHGLSIMEKAAAFVADYVFWDEKEGFYMTGPSYSPENMFSTGGKDYFLSLSSTCDVLLVREILEVYRKACRVMDREGLLYERAGEILKKLSPYKIGKYGQLQEWFYDFDEPIPNHRHTSHLLGLYPFRQIVPQEDTELARAAEVTLQRRYENFEITSWGMNMLLGYYARMEKSREAYQIICDTFRRLVKPNMASVMSDETSMWCGTWELDGNTGLTSAMAEMLVQSFEDKLILLPALPREWKNGEIRGLFIKGGHRVNLSWRDGIPLCLELLPRADVVLKVRFESRERTVVGRKDEKILEENW